MGARRSCMSPEISVGRQVTSDPAQTVHSGSGSITMPYMTVLVLGQTADFREFYAANEEWLRPYAVFCFLRDLFGTAEHWHWGVLARPTPEV
jgi:hypothetical protein